MALHGSATIELTNADGSKQIVKHDNMITNAVNDMLTSFRGEMPLVMRMASTGDSFVKHLFGGIMLFNERLTDDPADYAINTTKITGYAWQGAYSGTDLSRGSANLAESGLQEDGSYKLVFDFSTSQANGNIQSLGLCPNVMGKIGATDKKDTSNGFTFSIGTVAPFDGQGRLLTNNGSTDGISNWSFRIVSIIGDIAYAIAFYNIGNASNTESLLKNGGVLKLYKFKLGAFSVGLNNNVGRATYLECIDVQLPEDFINTLSTSSGSYTVSYYFDVDNKKLIVFPCSIKTDVPINGTVMYLGIDFANGMAITKYTFTNTTAGVIKKGEYTGFREQYHSIHVLYILKEYIVLIAEVSSKYRMYVINRADNAKVVEAKLAGEPFEPFTSISSSYGNFSGFSPVYVNDNVLVFARQVNNNYGYGYYMIDFRTGEVKETNCTRFYSNYTASFGNIASIVACDAYLAYQSYLNPFILTTKNNLDTPVVKTASQTMKITYTLTESEGV